MQNLMFHSNPKVYGVLYLLSIPTFGLIFYFLPETIGKERSLIENMYFSTVTITTLGYGDISPSNNLGRIIAATESVLGITLIGLFLNALSRVRGETSRTEEIEKEKKSYHNAETAKLSGFYNLITPLSEKYRLSVVQITNSSNSKSPEYDPKFTLNDMMDLYEPSRLLTQDFTKPSVEYYFTSMELLNGEIVDLIKNVDMRLFPKLEEHCLLFVKAVHSFDFSGYILGAVVLRVGNEKMTQLVKKTLENYEGEVEFSESPSMINAYIALHHQIKLQMGLLEKIDIELRKVIINPNFKSDKKL